MPLKKQTPIELTDSFMEQHEKGLAAIHRVGLDDPSEFVVKLDDRRIINNLREDGGTTDRTALIHTEVGDQPHYQLYTSISTTLLPPLGYKVAQEVYETVNICVFLDASQTRPREFCPRDGSADYKYTNKHNRPTYSLRMFDTVERFSSLSTRDSIRRLAELNTFQLDRSDTSRRTNECILKIYQESIKGLGVTIDALQFPGEILQIIKLQQLFRIATGVTYPIFIYNNSTEPVTLDLISSAAQTLQPNQVATLSPDSILTRLQEQYQGNERAFSYRTSFSFPHAGNNPISMTEFMKVYDQLTHQDVDEITKREQLTLRVQESLKTLSEFLLPLATRYEILSMHKEGRKDVMPSEQYEEIHQAALTRFVKIEVLGLREDQAVPPEQQDKYQYLLKAYNLQFRLNVYLQLLHGEDTVVNYSNLQKDLEWCSCIIKHDLSCEARPADDQSALVF